MSHIINIKSKFKAQSCICASGRKNKGMSRQSNIKMPKNSKSEIVYALQGARTLKNIKFKIQNFRVVKSASVSLGLAIVSIVSIVLLIPLLEHP